MAQFNKRLPLNEPGEIYVDETCIDCGTCHQLAPEVFADSGENSYVFHQPDTSLSKRHAHQALLACPTSSIGTLTPGAAKEALSDFPMRLSEEVYYTGFHSPASFGGSSYFIRHPDGNWLVDSPRYLPYLVKRFEALGGISRIFLSHRDDVADADRYATYFGSERIIHRGDLSAQPDAERIIEGDAEVRLSPEFCIIPVPGHTRGHCVLLYRDQFLFTGDHLWWNSQTQSLGASKAYCWYSWAEQTASMTRLTEYRFEWVLPGHGERIHLSAEQMHQQLTALVHRMQTSK